MFFLGKYEVKFASSSYKKWSHKALHLISFNETFVQSTLDIKRITFQSQHPLRIDAGHSKEIRFCKI